MKETFDIVDGPGMDVLFDACKYSHALGKTRIAVDFEVATAYTMPKSDPGCAYVKMPIKDLYVMGIGYDYADDSGETLIMYGFCEADPDSFGGIDVAWKACNFNASYNPKTHEGRITLAEGDCNSGLWKSISEQVAS